MAIVPDGRADLAPEQVPHFEIRFRVLSIKNHKPEGKKFTLFDVKGMSALSTEDQWSNWTAFRAPQVEEVLKRYPNNYLKRFPVAVKVRLSGIEDPTQIEAEIKLDENGEVVPLHADLFGPSLGFVLWRDEAGKPHVGTLADYNRLTIWDKVPTRPLNADDRPQKFPIVDRFIGGSDDYIEWREGVQGLAQCGFSTLMLPASAEMRALMTKNGLQRTAGAVYCPPGYVSDYGLLQKTGQSGQSEEQILDDWAQKLAEPYRKAGIDLHDVAVYGISDEPGWYYPATLQALQNDKAGMARFHQYLQMQKLRPADLGAASWEEVQPLGVSGAGDLPRRRLFYWTMRFVSRDSARYFADVTRAMNKAFYPGIPNFANWNFFSGRFYVPGPVANNRDKTSPDAAMGGHDWFEFAALHGSNMLWTEDWFGDGQAYQWSFYAAKLGPAARSAGINWGAYVIPRTSGNTQFGLMQKVLSVIGNGGKALKYFVFGPEYNFPGNCYSPRAEVLLPKMARVHRMIARAENLLWPGRKPQAQVAILQPRSSQVWDTNGISDATNTNPNRATVDYMAEVYDLYRGLQQQNIPADFIPEGALTPAGLKGYKVLFVTEPNFPAEWVPGLGKWVEAGGVLASVSGAFTYDRYNDPMPAFQQMSGIGEAQRSRLPVPNADTLPKVGRMDGGWDIYGVKGEGRPSQGQILAHFEGGTPAILKRKVARGAFIHYNFLPGVSAHVARQKETGLFPETALKWISYPVREAGVQPPVVVDQLNVETPVLISADGAALTLLNWRQQDVANLRVEVHLPLAVRSVESVTQGKIPFQQKNGDISFTVPLAGADIVMLKK